MTHHDLQGLPDRLTLTTFGVRQPVPANLLYIAIMILGLLYGTTLRREFFPEVRPNLASITAVYPGASPQEIEEGLVLKIEDKVAELDEVVEIRSTIVEGIGTVVVEFRRDIDDVDEAVRTVESALNTLTDLPEEAERIRTTKFDPKLQVIQIGLTGEAPEAELKRAIREIKDDLRSLPGMGNIVLGGIRADEISVKVRPEALLKYGLSLPDVSDRVREWMKEVPGGTVRTDSQNIRVRTLGIAERARAIRDIVVKGDAAGSLVRLGEIATIAEEFEDVEIRTRLNGKPVATLTAFNVGEGDAVEVAEMVRAYVAGRRGEPMADLRLADRWNASMNAMSRRGYEAQLAEHERRAAVGDAAGAPPAPPAPARSARMQAWELGAARTTPLPGELVLFSDLARFIEGRLDLLTRNAKWGAMLVFLSLLVFLNLRVALWVMLGLILAVLGTLAFMAAIGVTLNLLTMFGLIIVLGLLTDDAIVVAENITARFEKGEPALVAAVRGTGEVAWPVVATVTTTIAAFLPLAMIEGQIGDFLGALPIVVACALSVSLLEAIIILPAHMGHSLVRVQQRPRPWLGARLLRAFEAKRNAFLFERVVPAFGAVLDWSITHRYITVSSSIAVWIISIGMVVGGRVDFTFFEGTDSETFVVDLAMPVGTSIEKTDAVVRRIEAACAAQPEARIVTVLAGQRVDLNDYSPLSPQTHVAQLFVELTPVEQRDRTSQQIITAVRRKVGQVAGVDSLRYQEVQGGPGGPSINLVATGQDERKIRSAVEEIKSALAGFAGVVDISDDADSGQRELQIRLRDGSATLGLTPEFTARQVRGYLFGLEPHTFSINEEDVDVRVMLDDAARRSLAELERQYVFTPDGRAVPLVEVAELAEGSSYATIRRLDRRRAVTVLADVESAVNNPERVVAAMMPVLAGIEARYPGVKIEARGRQLETNRSLAGIKYGFLLACVMIYVILAWLFGSYFQPLAVMLAIPFSMIGMIWGHWLLGFKMMILSLIGFVALTGIVVNDSLIYIEFYNELKRGGMETREALIEAGRRRLRPIFLTTMTTVLGLSPLMLEQSFQARFLIPMAITISCGLISATAVVLMVLPSIMLVGHDVAGVVRWLWFGGRIPTETLSAGSSKAV